MENGKLWKIWEQVVEILGATCGNSIRRRRKNRVQQVKFYLCKWLPQAKKRFQSTIKWIFPYKISAAGENFTVSERY